jgi:hypothetical protein
MISFSRNLVSGCGHHPRYMTALGHDVGDDAEAHSWFEESSAF